jgi:serine phosphatase RsbU (regulator of sigma subunit)
MKTQRLRYVNCGYFCALLLRRDETLERLESTSTVLGLVWNWHCSLAESQLLPGAFLLYTDGATESCNDAGEEFGERRLVEAFRRHRGQPSRSLIALNVEEIRQFSPSDSKSLPTVERMWHRQDSI